MTTHVTTAHVLDRRTFVAAVAGLGATMFFGGCSSTNEFNSTVVTSASDAQQSEHLGLVSVVPTSEHRKLEDGLSCVLFEGDDRLDAFLDQGGALSDAEVVSFLAGELAEPISGAASFLGGVFGCSTIQAHTQDDNVLFGRNFDWYNCEACIVLARPEGSYASVSTVNTNFLSQYGDLLDTLPADARTLAFMYAPLDGMNERGLAVAVLMIQDEATIEQVTGKPHLTTTTAVRTMLDRAATVDEALVILKAHDLHASSGYVVHFALTDATGVAVAVEYVDGAMIVTETPVLTNFYVAEGKKQGIGTAQSHERFEILSEHLEKTDALSMEDMRDALDSVCKRNYSDGEITEWSMVCNQTTGAVHYYHREDYSHGWKFEVSQ